MKSKKYQYNGQTHIFKNRRELSNKPTHTQNIIKLWFKEDNEYVAGRVEKDEKNWECNIL